MDHCALVNFVGWAADPDPSSSSLVANPFEWFTRTPPDWGTGALFAALGTVGALVTVFSLIGGAIPGTAGSAPIEAGLKRLEEREKQLDKLIKSTSPDPKVIEAIERATNHLRDDLRTDRWRQFSLGAFLYALLGAAFAAMLARDLLQAVVIGAGWTAFLGAIGLKSDFAKRKEAKDETSARLESMLGDSGPPPGFEELREEARIARAL